MENRIKVKVTGMDGNIFFIVGTVESAMRKHGMNEQAKEMVERVFASESYHEALSVMNEYVELK